MSGYEVVEKIQSIVQSTPEPENIADGWEIEVMNKSLNAIADICNKFFDQYLKQRRVE